MEDPLDVEITKVRDAYGHAKAQGDRWLRDAELLKTRLQALEYAAQIRPAQVQAASPKDERKVGAKGRQPGAISKQWRKVLMTLASNQPSGAPEEHIAGYARSVGLPSTRLRDVRDRMLNYEAHGYVEPAGPGQWRVSELAKAKFRSEPPDAGHDETASDTGKTDAPREASAA